MSRMGATQRYCGYMVRRTAAGYSVELPSGAHLVTVPTFAEAIRRAEQHRVGA